MMMITKEKAKEKAAAMIAEIRESIIAENVSLGEIADLQGIGKKYPELLAGDTLLQEWAGLPETA